MAENGADGTAAAQPAEAKDQPKVNMRVLAQFVRDLSFENILAQKGTAADGQPDVSVQVSLDAKKRNAEHQFEVTTKLSVNAKAKGSGDQLFILELDYAGIFHVEGVPQEQMHPFLLIECPRMIFPFMRRVVSDITRDGGFPPLNLETIDFVGLYRTELMRRAEAKKAEDAAKPAVT